MASVGRTDASTLQDVILLSGLEDECLLFRSPSEARQSQQLDEIHGFASLSRDRFAFIVCNRQFPKEHCR